MPAPAVIPAPRAYIIAAAVKGFVVGARDLGWSVLFGASADRCPCSLQTELSPCGSLILSGVGWKQSRLQQARGVRRVTVNKTACPRQPRVRLNEKAWNDKGSTIVVLLFVGFYGPDGEFGRSLLAADLGGSNPPGAGLPGLPPVRPAANWDQQGLSGEDVLERER